ncbi:aflatoxin B1 aldehyde reductase-like protein [Auriculariales sp. MPI-PUGE-AT-0066]|nr:aflatoxin B1 aldehyde reductase-like protein [Auriculariales sp. MPI-PUGE-AT-0066]
MATSRSCPHLIFGGASLGLPGTEFDSPSAVTMLLERLAAHGVRTIDTAPRYPPTNPERSETLLGAAQAAASGFTIDTKLAFDFATRTGHGESVAVAASANASLARLNAPRVRTMYFHVKALKALQAAGKIEQVGVSNFSPDQVRDFVRACEENDGETVKPKLYQGEYNLIDRGMETELLPLLREHGIAFVAYRALAAGFMTGNFVPGETAKEGTRFSDAHPLGKLVQSLYSAPRYAQAWEMFSSALEHHGITPPEAGLRWICYHSALGNDDSVILGTSKIAYLEANIEAIEKGPLPSDLVEVLNRIGRIANGG